MLYAYAKKFYAGCPALSVVILTQFTFEMCAAAENCKKTLKKPLSFGPKVIQCHRC